MEHSMGNSYGHGLSADCAYRAELFLLRAVHIAIAMQVTLKLSCVTTEIVTQLLKRIKLLVSQQHVDAGDEDCGIFGQVVHRLSLLLRLPIRGTASRHRSREPISLSTARRKWRSLLLQVVAVCASRLLRPSLWNRRLRHACS